MTISFERYSDNIKLSQKNNQKFKIGGYRRDPADESDKKYGANRYQAEELPLRVDLRSHLTKVEQQGEIGSCTANAMAGAYEYLAKRKFGHAEDVSRLFIYYNARELDGCTDKDEGTYLRNCIKVLREYGACSERLWSYEVSRLFEQPHETAYAEAINFLIEDAQRINVDLYEMRHCLAEGYPFAFGLELFESFDKAESNGRVPMPNPDCEKSEGGHAMLCVGYSDQDRVFLVRNSWGSDWGDEGYCYIPYDYMTNPDLNGDCWTIRSVSDGDYSEGVWFDIGSFFGDEIFEAVARSLEQHYSEDEYEEEEEEEDNETEAEYQDEDEEEEEGDYEDEDEEEEDEDEEEEEEEGDYEDEE